MKSFNNNLSGFVWNIGPGEENISIICDGDGYITINYHDEKRSDSFPLTSELLSELKKIKRKLRRLDDEDSAVKFEVVNLLENHIDQNYKSKGITNLSRDVDSIVRYCIDGVLDCGESRDLWKSGHQIAESFLDDSHLIWLQNGLEAKLVIEKLDHWVKEAENNLSLLD